MGVSRLILKIRSSLVMRLSRSWLTRLRLNASPQKRFAAQEVRGQNMQMLYLLRWLRTAVPALP